MNKPVTMTTYANEFCYTHAMSSTGSSAMSMASTFQFSLAGGKECVTLWFQAFLLDTKAKFIAAMMGIFLLAVSIEALATLRHFVVKQKRCTTYTSNGRYSKLLVRLAMIVLFSVQSFFAYMLMLSVMTYSAEILIATILGLTTGYAVFFELKENKEDQTTNKQDQSDTLSAKHAAELGNGDSDNCSDDGECCDPEAALPGTLALGGPVNSLYIR